MTTGLQFTSLHYSRPSNLAVKDTSKECHLSTLPTSFCNSKNLSSGFNRVASMDAITMASSKIRPNHSRKNTSIKCAASQPNLKEQMKQMAAAERRWQSQVTEGKVKSLTSKEAGYAIQLNDHILLDVRPTHERNKAWVKNSAWVPAFDAEKGFSPGTLLNKFTTFSLGGWWSGAPLTKRNERFMPDVVAQIPKSANVIVACQKGLRSLAACEQLYKAGYRNIFWLNGGFDAAEEGDFERDGPETLKTAGIGGMSEFLGWTDVQRAQAAKEGFGYRAKLFARLVGVIIAADAIFVGSQELIKALHPDQ